jgi:hypothetical protein
MAHFVKFSVFDMGEFSLLTAPKIASRRLESVCSDLNNGTLIKFTFSCDFNGDTPNESKYFIDEKEIDIQSVSDKLEKIKYFVIRNPYERCFSGFMQHFHGHFLRNEFKHDEESLNFWTHNSTASFDYKKDTTANLDILFNPFPERIKSYHLQKEVFEENQSRLKEWISEWKQWAVDNIEFGIKNNMLEKYLLSDDHHAPYLILYQKLINSPVFVKNNIKFIRMENLDKFLGVKPNVTDSLGIFKKVDDSMFREFYNSSLVYKQEDSIWNDFIQNREHHV